MNVASVTVRADGQQLKRSTKDTEIALAIIEGLRTHRSVFATRTNGESAEFRLDDHRIDVTYYPRSLKVLGIFGQDYGEPAEWVTRLHTTLNTIN